MEKRKWLWKRKSSERNPGESESSGSFSSNSERYSDEQDVLNESPGDRVQSPEVTSKATITEEMKESMKCLTEKLSAALANVSAKEDLVKQHAKVAEEAVAGWEKAENEVTVLKQQLEAAVQQNLNLEVRASHLDGALKECTRQLRQAKDEQDKRITDAILEKSDKWETTKAELEKQILELQVEAEAATAENSASTDPNLLLMLGALEKDNSFLKQELLSRHKQIEIMTIERDLCTQAAESASKLQLESVKKVTKLEAECRRLQSMVRKSSLVNSQRSASASSFYAESLTDSQSDTGERLNTPDLETHKMDTLERNEAELSCLDSWASALIAELDQFKNRKSLPKNFVSCSVEIDMMDDFLEMERLAALHEIKSSTPIPPASESRSAESLSMDNPLRAELDLMIQQVTELEKNLERIKLEKLEIENALDESHGSLKEAESQIAETKIKLEELQKELAAVNKDKELLEFQLIRMEVEARTTSATVDSLKVEIENERNLSAELKTRCQELENELNITIQGSVIQQNKNVTGELKLKQEDLAVAADKLAECQRTITSLGMQLKSLATLEDFLIDTSSIPGLSSTGQDICKSPPSIMFVPKSDPSKTSVDHYRPLINGNCDESHAFSQSVISVNHANVGKNHNGFGKFFSRSKSVVEHGNHQD